MVVNVLPSLLRCISYWTAGRRGDGPVELCGERCGETAVHRVMSWPVRRLLCNTVLHATLVVLPTVLEK